MAKYEYEQKTKVFLGDEDISNVVTRATIRRGPGLANSTDLTLLVDRLEVEEDGTLVIRVLLP